MSAAAAPPPDPEARVKLAIEVSAAVRAYHDKTETLSRVTPTVRRDYALWADETGRGAEVGAATVRQRIDLALASTAFGPRAAVQLAIAARVQVYLLTTTQRWAEKSGRGPITTARKAAVADACAEARRDGILGHDEWGFGEARKKPQRQAVLGGRAQGGVRGGRLR